MKKLGEDDEQILCSLSCLANIAYYEKDFKYSNHKSMILQKTNVYFSILNLMCKVAL
jgi:hypothetical protein